jgi:Protein of unknown function (DUF3142)
MSVPASNSLQINLQTVATCLLAGRVVTRPAKIRGGSVVALLVCLLLPLVVQPQFAHALLRRLHLFHSNHFSRPASSPQLATLPNLFFWAWERPEDLRFLESRNAGVAFLAKTIYVPSSDEGPRSDGAGSLFVRPRLQPLRTAPGTPLIAVVRIETRAGRQPELYVAESPRSWSQSTFTPLQKQRLVGEIVDLKNLPNIRAIQIDFDATLSERAAYANLLKDLRRSLPASLPLSITALASWCIGDPWLEQLPPGTIDEAVPMLFRIGPDTANVAKFLHSGEGFRVSACQDSLGLTTDEPLSNGLLNGTLPSMPAAWRAKRIYVFAPRAWTQPAAEAVLKEWQP